MYYLMYLQDYHWWWRSFLTSGFTAIYFFVYCVHYFISKLDISGFSSTVLYFGYTFIMVFLFFLLTGELCKVVNRIELNSDRNSRTKLLCTNICYCNVIIFSFRIHWFLCMLLVCVKDLQCCESRLTGIFCRTKLKISPCLFSQSMPDCLKHCINKNVEYLKIVCHVN